MLSFRNILFISPPPAPPPPPPPPPPPSSINFVSGNPEYVLSGLEEKVCTDCGNRAKKECAFGRCRTCCKSRGYDCATHVKSTWVSAAERRDRKVIAAAGSTGAFARSGSSCSGSKKQRTEVSEHNKLTKVSLGLRTSSSHQDASFKETLPGKVQAAAAFRRIKVTAITNGESEIAYQATVTISGHVFKGFLYHYGIAHQNNPLPYAASKPPNEQSSGGRTIEKGCTHRIGAIHE